MKIGRGSVAVLGLIAALALARRAESAPSCLPERRVDLQKLVESQPLAPPSSAAGAGQTMVPVTRGAPRWMAAWNAVLAWQNDDCPAFAAFAEKMGYEAAEVLDTVTGTRHWLLAEPAAPPSPGAAQRRPAPRWNGLFVLRAPKETASARRLIISAPHLGQDFSDGRAVALYQKLDAIALLQNSAHRANLTACSGCVSVPGEACALASDAAHAVDHMLFALFAALEATRTHAAVGLGAAASGTEKARPFLHFEYHGMADRPALPASMARCAAVAEISHGAAVPSGAAADAGSYPSRFWRALEKRLGPQCVCYHQQERGCLLFGTQSVLGRLVNQESPGPFDPCTQEATRLSRRHVHFEGYAVPFEAVFAALAEAVPK